MTLQSRVAEDLLCDAEGCPATAEDVDPEALPTGWLLVEEGGIWPGADAHYCPDHGRLTA